jgi:hypothetical protein
MNKIDYYVKQLESEMISYKGDKIPESIKESDEFNLKLLKKKLISFSEITSKKKYEKSFILGFLDICDKKDFFPKSLISNASESIRDDEDVMSKVLLLEPSLIRELSERLKNDKNFLHPIVKKNNYLITEIGEDLRKDRSFVLNILTNTKVFPNYTIIDSELLKKDKDIALLVIKNGSPECFYKLSNELKKDRDIVFQAVKSLPVNLQFVNGVYKSDKEIVKMAVVKKASTFQFARRKLREDKEFVLDILDGLNSMISLDLLGNLKDSFKLDIDILKEVFKHNYPGVLQCSNYDEILLHLVEKKISLNDFFSIVPNEKMQETSFLLDVISKYDLNKGVYYHTEGFKRNKKFAKFYNELDIGKDIDQISKFRAVIAMLNEVELNLLIDDNGFSVSKNNKKGLKF